MQALNLLGQCNAESNLAVFSHALMSSYLRFSDSSTGRLTDWLAMGSPIAVMIAEYIRNHSPTAQHHVLEDFSLHQDCLMNQDCAVRFICTFMLYIYWHADIIFIVTGFEICACIFHKFDSDSDIFWPA